jgi:alpha-L-rhamnosidase
MIENGKWIACPKEAEVPVIRKTFRLNRPESGRIEITGLGFFTLFVNGQRVTEDRFVPALTDYEPRLTYKWHYPIFDERTHRILYLTYDLSAFLQDGAMKAKPQAPQVESFSLQELF